MTEDTFISKLRSLFGTNYIDTFRSDRGFLSIDVKKERETILIQRSLSGEIGLSWVLMNSEVNPFDSHDVVVDSFEDAWQAICESEDM